MCNPDKPDFDEVGGFYLVRNQRGFVAAAQAFSNKSTTKRSLQENILEYPSHYPMVVVFRVSGYWYINATAVDAQTIKELVGDV